MSLDSNSPASDVEYVVEDDSTPVFSPDPFVPTPSAFERAVSLCQIFLPRVQFAPIGDDSVEITIPTSFIPHVLAVTQGFDKSPVLLTLTLILLENRFPGPGRLSNCANPVYGAVFPGRALVGQAAVDFFAPSYRPKREYRSLVYVMEPVGIADDWKVAILASEGFSVERSAHALGLTGNQLEMAREFLLTSVLTESRWKPQLPEVEFCESALLYFILEITEAIFRLQTHCFVCGEPLGLTVLRPSLCNKAICFFGATEIGLCSSVVTEIKRDPVVADFLVSLASAAFGTKWFNPPLPPQLEPQASSFFQKCPAMSHLEQFNSDAAIRDAIGKEHYEILRFILLSNRSTIVQLPAQLKMGECGESAEQLLCINAIPEMEVAFRRKAHGNSVWLWHGSTASRWHSILHTGLRDLGNTTDRTHAGASTFGPGVYQSHLSEVSISYAGGENPGVQARNTVSYANSRFGNRLLVLALCENVPGPLLRQVAQSEWTQQESDGLIVRGLFVVKQTFNWDLVQRPPSRVPTLQHCLRYLAERMAETRSIVTHRPPSRGSEGRKEARNVMEGPGMERQPTSGQAVTPIGYSDPSQQAPIGYSVFPQQVPVSYFGSPRQPVVGHSATQHNRFAWTAGPRGGDNTDVRTRGRLGRRPTRTRGRGGTGGEQWNGEHPREAQDGGTRNDGTDPSPQRGLRRRVGLGPHSQRTRGRGRTGGYQWDGAS
jgi:hypothetical protein